MVPTKSHLYPSREYIFLARQLLARFVHTYQFHLAFHLEFLTSFYLSFWSNQQTIILAIKKPTKVSKKNHAHNRSILQVNPDNQNLNFKNKQFHRVIPPLPSPHLHASNPALPTANARNFPCPKKTSHPHTKHPPMCHQHNNNNPLRIKPRCARIL